MRRIKIAQIGTNRNSHSMQIFNSLVKQSDLFDVAGYVLPENERERISDRVEKLQGREMTLDEVLSDPSIEAVTVETDEIYLTEYALMAAKAGKHIHMEKPGGVSLAAFEELIAAMKNSGKVFHTGYMYRYNPLVKELMSRIKSDELGQITCVEAQMDCWHNAKTRQWLEAFPGGMMFYLGCHLVDLVLRIKGAPCRIIPLNGCSGADGVTAKDVGMAALEYDDGVSFVKTSACQLGGYAVRRLLVSGMKGTVLLQPFEMAAEGGGIYTGKTEFTSDKWADRGVSTETEPFDRYDGMMRAFGEYVLGEKENPFTPDYELELFKTVLKCCGE